MNDLYLIGNGFDLAHGLKTSYNDFLLWYLNDFFKKSFRKDHHEDDLLKIDRLGAHYNLPDDFNSVKDIFQKLNDLSYKLKANHDFFGRIIENYRDYKWVDIEYEYYMALVEIYRDMEKSNVLRSDFHFSRVKPLNDCFETIKIKLVEYLHSIEISSDLKNKHIEEILFEGTGTPETRAKGQLGGLLSNEISKGEKLFVCFNFTPMMEIYVKKPFLKYDLIYIHGELSELLNPIIFGYGDEMDPHYEKIENLNTKEFLDNMKSFGYFRTDNYQRVIRFVDSGEFTVKILGHSCGLSDRILLNSIFEHKNCEKIKIYHYEKSPTENDYFEKTQEISCHFKSSGKGNMRMKVVPFNKYSLMPQVKKDN